MPSENGEAYVIRDAGDDVWERPMPVSTAVVNAVTDATDLAGEDLADLDSYVDVSDLQDVLAAEEGAVEFAVEGHEVRVTADGDIEVRP